MLVEREATHRAIALSELVDVPIMIVHVSGREAVEQIRWARSHGLKRVRRDLPAVPVPNRRRPRHRRQLPAARAASAARRRATKDNQQVIWNGLADGLFTIFSSDHAPFRYDAPEGKKPGGPGGRLPPHPERHPGHRDAPAAAVLARRARRPHHHQPLRRADVHQPAKAYGLHPRKGTIAVGADADLVVWGATPRTVRNADLHHASTTRPTRASTWRPGRR